LSTQRARDREAKDVLASMHGGPIDPACPHACGEAEAPTARSAQTLSVDDLVVYEEY
jgi:hypothetical protein